ncbi:hypothetical protein HYC85_018003 [Camellia sinensis]|uniref:Plant bHLH transcription factor ACT-like domain-containing protein n=1 Tax=Camellia sinensis TaxID=4442 RepID=A0A7J7GWN9_CAMSI|nr:hypothetical protein HYC85_018003 [Camellia sinensis]
MASKLQKRMTLRRKLHVLKTLTNSKSEVKVEKVGEEFLVRVTCKKGQDVLVSILEAFEEMGLNVLQARVSCNYFLNIEAIVKAQDQGIDVREITQAVHKAIGKQDGEGTQIL